MVSEKKINTMKFNQPNFCGGNHQFADMIINSSQFMNTEDVVFLDIIEKYLPKRKKRRQVLKNFELIKHPKIDQLEKNDALVKIKNILDRHLPETEIEKINTFLFEKNGQPDLSSKNSYYTEYDIFLSFAEEDVDFARKIYDALCKRDLMVWFSQEHLKTGDSIVGVINEAVKRSHYGLILLSPHTIESEIHFPFLELTALLNKKLYGQLKGLIPLYHHISHKEIVLDFPLLADHTALNTTAGIATVADKIMQIVK